MWDGRAATAHDQARLPLFAPFEMANESPAAFATRLRRAVRFYATRDVARATWYPRDARGRLQKLDDLPERYRGNVNMDPPFGGKPGDRPALDEAEIADIVAFLGTLTDGY
jgi:cytochrome c peroxidase